jgi:hypothetical protein
MMSAIMLNVVMLGVVAPSKEGLSLSISDYISFQSTRLSKDVDQFFDAIKLFSA